MKKNKNLEIKKKLLDALVGETVLVCYRGRETFDVLKWEKSLQRYSSASLLFLESGVDKIFIDHENPFTESFAVVVVR